MPRYNDLARVILLLILSINLMACGSSPAEPTVLPPTMTLPATATVAPTLTPEVAATSAATESASPTAQPQLADIMTILARAEGLETFVAAIENAGLTEQLQGKGPFTVFVSPNPAWDELPPAVLTNATLMREILLEQIVEGHILMPDMIAAGKAVNLRNDELVVLSGQAGATIQGANVLGADFVANNGVIHLIDTVILPQAVTTEVMALYPSVVGEQTYPMQGNIHIARGERSPVAYNSAPPTSGPHYSTIVAWQLYEEPALYEQLVHNLEDGGVIIYYQCETACPELVEQLRTVTQPYMDAGRHVVVTPNDPNWTTTDGSTPHADMGAAIAVTAWRKLLKLDEVDGEKIRQFVEAFEGIDHHVQ